MTDTAVALNDLSPFAGRTISLGRYRRYLLAALVVAFGTLAAAWAITTVLTVATTWMAAAVHSANPVMQGRRSLVASEIMALANPYGALATAVFGSVRAVNVPNISTELVFDPAWTNTDTAGFAAADRLSAMSYDRFKLAALPPTSPGGPVTAPPLLPGVTAPADTLAPAAVGNAVPMPPKRVATAELPSAPAAAPAEPKRDAPPAAAAPETPQQPEPSGPFAFFKKLFTPHEPGTPPKAGERTAVYDIEAHTVYLPNGERLEAHSGMGHLIDDPRYVSAKNRGPTPPHVYELTLRRPLFHGVQAIRLTPVGGGTMYGRDGILAHSYMLGPSGQSNGCVSFRDYRAFLRAYLDGKVDRIIVVPSLKDRSIREARARATDAYAYSGK